MPELESRFEMKWYGWGSADIRYPVHQKPGILSYLEETLGITELTPSSPPDLSNMKIPDSSIPESLVETLKGELGSTLVSMDRRDRILHCLGKSYKDLLRLRSGKIEKGPDLILYPASAQDLPRIFQVCRKYRIAIVPFGGGTSVVGGVEPYKADFPFLATVDLRRLKKVLSLDPASLIAHVEAGIFGPELEEKLQSQGYTVGHYPQSFEFSTLGGWIAARSSGQNSLQYGGIEKIVQSIDVLSPIGEVETLATPRMACGPDWKELFLGSEGCLGVITSAKIRIQPVPDEKLYFLSLFPDFKSAALACRKVTQKGLSAAMLRASDEEETRAMMAMGRGMETLWSRAAKKFARKYLELKNFDLSRFASVMVGLEGTARNNSRCKKKIRRIFQEHGSVYLGTSPGEKWLKDRFFLPYLRDDFMDNGLLVDTLETSTTWERLEELYHGVRDAIISVLSKTSPCVVYTHISHLYPDGASLYFSILARQDPADPMAQWSEMKAAANQKISSLGAAISHHHGVGMDHKNSLHYGEVEKGLFQQVKAYLDPDGILNPGKML
jgi:alkyldihydroxyacetonephosphate synthase